MSYTAAVELLLLEPGVELSSMMKSPCLRYKGEFMAMMFDKKDALIIKVAPARVDELIESDIGLPFEFTKKRFKEWVLIPRDHQADYHSYIRESLDYAKRA